MGFKNKYAGGQHQNRNRGNGFGTGSTEAYSHQNKRRRDSSGNNTSHDQNHQAQNVDRRTENGGKTQSKKPTVAVEKLSPLPTPNLPINEAQSEITKMVLAHPAVVLVGETGSGKTTQVPQYMADHVVPEMGRPKYEVPKRNTETGQVIDGEFIEKEGDGIVVVTQPRRVAAISVAQYVAKLRGSKLGDEVGYAVRFDEKTRRGVTKLKFVTDGILLKELLANEDLPQYSVIILDEAHERTLHGDVLFGLLKQLLYRRRTHDLKVVVMSATLNTQQFSNFWKGAPVGLVKGRTHPVDIYNTVEPQADFLDSAVNMTIQCHLDEPIGGDILVFLTGQEAIEGAAEILEERRKLLDSTDKGFLVVKLYAAMDPEKQMEAFEKTPNGERKVILATNIAETSITIEGIKYVIDCGLLKARQFNERTGIEMLVETPVSQAQAKQRSGRAGRLTAGKCFRLYTKESFDEMAENPVPEILRCSLMSVVLSMKAMGIDDLMHFDFMDRPSPIALLKSLEQLWRLGALDKKRHPDGSTELPLTKLGRLMADFPIDPPGARTLLRAIELGVFKDVAKILAMLSTENVLLAGYFDGKSNKGGGGDGGAGQYKSSIGDHLTLLNILNNYIKSVGSQSVGAKREWCSTHHINYRQMEKVMDTEKQLVALVKMKGNDGKLAEAGLDLDNVPTSLAGGFGASVLNEGEDDDTPAMSGGPNSTGFGSKAASREAEDERRRKHQMNDYSEVRRAFCAGFFLQTAYWSRTDDSYIDNITAERVKAHPTSVIFGFTKRKPELVLYNNLLVTRGSFMRDVVSIKKEWLSEACPSLFPSK